MDEESVEADRVFGALLKEARNEAGLSTIDLAEKLFLTRESVDRYMRGDRRPSRDLVERWEELCKLPTGSLVDTHDKLPPRGPRAGKAAPNSGVGAPPDHAPSADTPAEPAAIEDAALVGPQVPEAIGSPRSEVVVATTVPARRGRVVVAAIAAAVAAGAIGLFVGHAVHAATGSDRSESLASNSDLELHVPASWLRTTTAITPPRLGLSEAIVIAADSPRGAGVIAGVSDATGITLLTPGVLRRLDRWPSRDFGERLGSLDTYRYADLHLRDFAGRVTLFVAPTSIGALTLACFTAGPATPRFRSNCRTVAQSVRLRRGRSYPLGPALSYQRGLNGMLTQLNVARRRDRAALKSARTHEGQAALADRLSTAFAVARAQAAGFDVSPRELAVHRQILRALRSASDAYTRMAAAARRSSRGRYNDARRRVVHVEHRIRTTIRELARLGYP